MAICMFLRTPCRQGFQVNVPERSEIAPATEPREAKVTSSAIRWYSASDSHLPKGAPLNLALSFVEYAAVNSIREVGPKAFALLSTAKLGQEGNTRMWLLNGEAAAFGSLLADVTSARTRNLSSAMSKALAGVSSAIEAIDKPDS